MKKDPRREFAHRAKSGKDPSQRVCSPCNSKKGPSLGVCSSWNDEKGPSQEVCTSCNDKKDPFFFTCSSCKPKKCTIPPPCKPCKPQKCSIPTSCKPCKPQKCTILTPCKPRKPQKIPLASFPAFSNNQKNQLTKTLHLRITRKIWWWRSFFLCAGFRCSQFFLASAPSKRTKCLPLYSALGAQPQTLIVERVEVFLQEKKNLIFHLLVGLVLQVMTPGLH